MLDTWQNIRIEYTPSEDSAENNYTGTVKFYLNGELARAYVTSGYDGTATQSNASLVCATTNFDKKANTGYGGYTFFDNTFMSAVTEE